MVYGFLYNIIIKYYLLFEKNKIVNIVNKNDLK